MNGKQLYKSCFVALLLFAGTVTSRAQDNLAIGQWRMHLPYNKLHSVAEGNGNIYCASADGMFIYNKADGNITRLTRLEGLSDFGITHIRYNQQYNVLMITYANSNIDLLFANNTIINMSDLKRADIIGSKEIHSIYFNGQYAYLSCGFGIAVIDMLRLEVKDTYFIGAGGSPFEVFGTAVYNNRLWAGTESGVYYADLNNPLISLYSSWTKDTTLPDPNKPYNFIVNYGNKIIANNDSTGSVNVLMQYDGTAWSNFIPVNLGPETTVANNLDYYNERLIKVNNFSISAYDLSGNRTRYIDVGSFPNSQPKHGLVDAAGIFWIADDKNGLVKSVESWDNTFIYPNGPYSVNAYAMASLNGRLWTAGGMVIGNIFDNTYSKDGVYLFKNNHWTSINRTNDIALDTLGAYDFVSVAIDPSNPDHCFFGSWGRGLYEFDENGYLANYDESNSTINPLPNTDIRRVGGLSFDSDNNLWICNMGTANPISVKRTNGTWQSYGTSLLLGQAPTIIMCDSRNRKWILIPYGGGLIVFDENNIFHNSPDIHARKFAESDTAGDLVHLNVQCIAEDFDGQIWIGTEKGVQVLYSPDGVYDDYINFQQIQVEVEGNLQYLLETEMVTAMAIDGANRKWFGTASSGVYLTSADGTQQIFHFTPDNSPLLSNNIFAIAVDNKTGEVFFATEKGIVSYKGDAIEGTEDYEEVYVYPNPVRPGYSGIIAVRGLVANANVKITDVSGNLVYETKANGGQAIWNGTNFRGEKAHSGVYLVFCSNDDGTKTFVTKLLMMH
jgi:ligand-binding sensor domain-containing protein